MVIPKGMVIPKSKIYQAKEWNGGRNVIPFHHTKHGLRVRETKNPGMKIFRLMHNPRK